MTTVLQWQEDFLNQEGSLPVCKAADLGEGVSIVVIDVPGQ